MQTYNEIIEEQNEWLFCSDSEKEIKHKDFIKRRKETFFVALDEKLKKVVEKNQAESGTIRIELNSTSAYQLFNLLKKQIKEDELELFTSMDVIDTARFIPRSYKKVMATTNANAAKINKSKQKVQNAINLLRLEGKEITPYAVAKTAHMSYNTAKKYLPTFTKDD